MKKRDVSYIITWKPTDSYYCNKSFALLPTFKTALQLCKRLSLNFDCHDFHIAKADYDYVVKKWKVVKSGNSFVRKSLK